MMLKKNCALWALCLTMAWLALPLQAQDSSTPAEPASAERPPLEEMPQSFQLAYWLNQAALAFDDGDYEDWGAATERLHALRPYNQDFMTHLVRAYAEQERYSDAYNMMVLMQQQGLAEDWSRFDELAPMRNHEVYNHISEMMTRAGESFGEFRQLTVLDDVPMPEALAYDEATGRYFLGTVRQGKIHVSENGQDFEVFVDREQIGELMAVLDVEVDAERRHLWVATAALPQWERYRSADRGRTLLLKIDLDSAELLSTHRLIPDRRLHAFGSLAIAGDGTVFAADTATPGVYRLAPDAQYPELFFTHQNFSSMRGIALSDDDSKLYLADYEIGIFVVDTSDASKAWKLFTPENLNEGGIDGLYFWDGHLVAIQNGVSPDRVVRMKLGDDGLGVIEVAPLVAALPQFDTPTFGVIVDDELVFLAGSHWRHVDSRGRRTGTGLPSIAVLATEIDSARVLGVGQPMIDEIFQRRGGEPEDDSSEG
jgi:sugar lactone lactonase YvrE